MICLLLVTLGTTLFALSDFLELAWLGLPALGLWMWAGQLGALVHLKNRKHGLDLFTELFYALGFDDRLDKLASQVGTDVADIIDLQAERQKVARARSILLEGTSGSETVVEEDPDVVHSPADDLH